jgi:translation initiation factor 6
MIQQAEIISKIKIQKISYKGSENIGLFAFLNEKVCISPPEFKVPSSKRIIHAKIFGSEFVGAFLVGNSNGILIPKNLSKKEISVFEKGDINFTVIKSRINTLGNMVLCNDYGCLIPEELKKFKKEISEALDVKVEVGSIANSSFLGSCAIATNQGALLHRDCSLKELKKVEKILGVKADVSSINLGSPYIGFGALANTKEVFVGFKTTPYEIIKIAEVLGVGRLDE